MLCLLKETLVLQSPLAECAHLGIEIGVMLGCRPDGKDQMVGLDGR